MTAGGWAIDSRVRRAIVRRVRGTTLGVYAVYGLAVGYYGRR